MAELADRLSARFGGAQAFFCNSGAEAVEAALKYARKATGRHAVAALEGSFHGRTLGALAVTGQPAKRQAFEPLPGPVSLRAPERRRLARGGGRAGRRGSCILEPVLGRGRRRSARARVPGGRGRARGGARRAAGLRRDPDRGGEDRHVLRLGAGRRAPRPRHARQGPRQRPAARLPAGRRRGGRGASGPATTPRRSVGTRSRVRRRAPSATRSTKISSRALGGAARSCGPGSASSAPSGRRAVAASSSAPSSTDRRERCRGLSGARALVTSAGDRVLRLTPPLTIERADVDEALDILREVLA